MSQVKTTISPGICGMNTEIQVRNTSAGKYEIQVNSPCKKVEELWQEISDVDPVEVATAGFCQNPIYKAATAHRLHAGCPIPTALVKTLEVACGLALPADVTIDIERD